MSPSPPNEPDEPAEGMAAQQDLGAVDDMDDTNHTNDMDDIEPVDAADETEALDAEDAGDTADATEALDAADPANTVGDEAVEDEADAADETDTVDTVEAADGETDARDEADPVDAADGNDEDEHGERLVPAAAPPAPRGRRTRRHVLVASGVAVGLLLAACTVPQIVGNGNGDGTGAGTGGGTGTPVTPSTTTGASKGIWISTAELMALPMSGPSWVDLVEQAEQDPGEADIADQDSNHDVLVLAEALVAVRAGRDDLRRKAIDGLLAVIGTDENRDSSCEWKPNIARSLAIGRNLSSYVIAADVLGLYPDGDPGSAGSRFGAWVEMVRHKQNCPHTGNGQFPDGEWFDLSQFHDWSASNVSSMAGGSRVAAALYVGDDEEVRAAWQTFRRFTGDRTAGHELDFNDNGLTWSSVPFAPVAINPPGARIDGRDVDGALVNDIGRGGEFDWPPGHTQYPWEGLAGLFVQAELFQRAGFPAYAQEQDALLRAVRFMRRLADEFGDEWWDHSNWVKYVCNRAYGTDLPVSETGVRGKNMAWTDWTHGPGRAPSA